MEEARKKGPAVVFDAGNALFKQTGINDEKAQQKAKFILQKYAALGVKVMGVGARDLNATPAWLQREAAAVGIEPLSVNLVDTGGKPFFKASKVLTEGGLKLGFIGATAVGAHGDFTAKAALPLVKAEALKLRPDVDLVIVLAAVSYTDALQLSNELKESVDLIIQSHENRGSGIAQKGPGNFVLPAGERGRHIARVDLSLGGKGPLQDLGEQERNAQVIKILDNQIQEVRRRKLAAKDAALRAELDKTEIEFQRRKKQELAAMGGKKSDRTFKLQFVGLGGDVADDPEWKKEIDRLEPPNTRGH